MKVGIIGGGIIGLTTGVVLAESGHDVKIFSRDHHTKTTSWAAAAISCPVNVEDSPRVNHWFEQTNAVLKNLTDDPRAGVSHIEWKKFSLNESCPHPSWMEHVNGARILESDECPAPYRSGIFAPHMQMVVDFYFPYMMDRFGVAGGVYEIREIQAPENLSGAFDVLVNATGVYARQFVGDESVNPARGQVVIVRNSGVAGHTATFDTKHYIYPRGEHCLLGGSFDEGEWDTVPDPELTRAILKWVAAMESALADAEIVDVRVGLRPLRPAVRLEMETLAGGTPLVHNYGHGGAGYTLSWGCAFDVLQMLKNA